MKQMIVLLATIALGCTLSGSVSKLGTPVTDAITNGNATITSACAIK